MSNFFKVKEHGSTVRTEIMAGVTTFMAMAYILMVNAGMFSSLGTVSYGAIYIATAISAVIGTVLIGLLSNLPLAQASGMGLNPTCFLNSDLSGKAVTYTFPALHSFVKSSSSISGACKKYYRSA